MTPNQNPNQNPSQNPNEQKGLTPDGLAGQLFDVAISQNPSDPRGAARQVVDFLASALFYAITSSKGDVIVFLTEALIYMASASAEDEAARKELLKHIGDTIANAPPIPGATAAGPQAPVPAGTPSPAGK